MTVSAVISSLMIRRLRDVSERLHDRLIGFVTWLTRRGVQDHFRDRFRTTNSTTLDSVTLQRKQHTTLDALHAVYTQRSSEHPMRQSSYARHPTRRSKCASRTRTRTPVLQSTQLKTNFGSTDYYIALVYVSLLCVGSYEVLRTQLRVRIIARTSCHMHTTSLPQSFPNTEAGQSNL